MTNNVIVFPKSNSRPISPSIDQVKASLNFNKEGELHAIAEIFGSTLIDNLETAGYSVADPRYMKNVCMILESIRALLHQHDDLPHPFHRLADQFFEVDETDTGVRFVLPDMIKEEITDDDNGSE